MREKIINIKNILKIIIAVFIIFNMCKSCTKAYTPDDILADLTTLYDNELITGLPTDYDRNPAWGYLTSFYNSYGIYNYHIGITSSNSTYLSNKLVVGLFSSATYITNYTNDTSNTYYDSWKGNTYQYSWFVFNLNASNYSNGSYYWNRASWSYMYTTLDINTRGWQQDANTEYGGNYLTESFEFTPKATEVVDTNVNVQRNIYRYADTELGTITKYLEDSRFTYIVLKQNNNIVGQLIYNNKSLYDKETNGYMTIQHWFNGQENEQDVLFIFSSALYLDELYTLEIYNGGENLTTSNYNDKQTFYYMFVRQNAVITNGTITSYGSGDGYTAQNSTTAIVANQNQNNSFWKNSFDNLFTISSGDIEQIKTKLQDKFGTSGDNGLAEELQIINSLTDLEPYDFKITWKPVYYQGKIIIPSGDVNFSQQIRENETFTTIQNYTQVFLISAMAWLILHEWWKCICITLGIGTQLYETYEDENQVIETQNEVINGNTGMSTISTTRTKGGKSVTIRTRAPYRKRLNK